VNDYQHMGKLKKKQNWIKNGNILYIQKYLHLPAAPYSFPASSTLCNASYTFVTYSLVIGRDRLLANLCRFRLSHLLNPSYVVLFVLSGLRPCGNHRCRCVSPKQKSLSHFSNVTLGKIIRIYQLHLRHDQDEV
jgi:hypothetical protein